MALRWPPSSRGWLWQPYTDDRNAVKLSLVCRPTLHIYGEELTASGRHRQFVETSSLVSSSFFPFHVDADVEMMSNYGRRSFCDVISWTIVIAIYVGLCYLLNVGDAGGLPNVIRIGTSVFSCKHSLMYEWHNFGGCRNIFTRWKYTVWFFQALTNNLSLSCMHGERHQPSL